MATVAVDVGDLPQFDCTDASGLSPRWKRWFRAFELFATGKGVEKPEQMKALLLHKAGMRVQDIYFTLPEVDGNDDCYKKCVKVLNQYFTPESNIPYERHVFRNMRQSSTETMEQFVTRLRQQSETCEFGDLNSVDVQIRDQVIEKCHSNHLRRKFLERGTSLDLKKMRELARVFEDTERQASTMEGLNTEVNRLSIRGKFKTGQSQRGYSKVKCYCCGFEGHTHKDSNCPARGRKCRKCNGIGHFERCCKTKSKEDYRRNNHRGYKHKKTVNQVDTKREESEQDFSFSVSSDSEDYEGEITVVAGGVKLKMLIDSGTTCNIIDRNTWEHLKASGIKCTSKKEKKNIYPYGSTKSLQVAGTFTCEVNCCGRDLETVEFTVMEGKGPSLLGRKTAIQLGVLKLGPHVNAVRTDDTTDKIKTDYKDCFQGFGKLNNFQLNIPVEADAQPIALPLRRIPYHLRDRLSKKLDELEDLDIIEKVEGPSSWVSPVVVVPKGDKDIRLCVDMRMANESVRRARHPIPTIDEVLQDFNQSKIFSKLDIKWAYHQIELSEDARDITTFITHKGLYRYKRLMFGISCAPEMYQKVLQQLLQNCDGAHNILDDIIVHAETEEEHDKRLRQVLDVIRDRGMTLNADKCLFKMKKLEFMGHVLSDKGIGPTETKIKAVQEARAPESASEVRSFLGLVNFTARYIENLATVSEPLRRLTRKDEPFVWGSDQEKAFQELN